MRDKREGFNLTIETLSFIFLTTSKTCEKRRTNMKKEFKDFKKAIQEHFKTMTSDPFTPLFEVALDKDELWNLYLDSFPAGTNEIYRKRREYDCSCCRQFIRTIGNVVLIDKGELHTIWELTDMSETFQPVCDALDAFVKSKPVRDIFIPESRKIGCDYNFEQLDYDLVKTWHHLYLEVPEHLMYKGELSWAGAKGAYRDVRHVFKRSLDELTMEAVNTVLDMIRENILYKGNEWDAPLHSFKYLKKLYDEIEDENKRELFAWRNAAVAGPVVGKIKNHSIGVLLTDISEGVELEQAVKNYERITAPTNYKRPKAIYTKKMLEDAQQKITELGYLDSLPRRFAKLDDITINNVLFANKDAAKRMSGDPVTDIFEAMKEDVAISPRRFEHVETVSAQSFVTDILPDAREIEVFVENKHSKNFVSMIAPVNKDSKSMFKWNNSLSWAYTGNITDSDIRQNVKTAGGSVDGDLRFSIQWNEDGNDNCDLDAHAWEPGYDTTGIGKHIFFGSCKKPRVSRLDGQLDVDIIHPDGKVAVENITWPNRQMMIPGMYIFKVHVYNGIARKGFRAEIEFDGEIYEFNCPHTIRQGDVIDVAGVELTRDREFKMVSSLNGNSKTSSIDIWGVKTNKFTPVSVVSYSPNYFDEQEGIGHKHLFFFLKNCVNPEEPYGFYNEYLKNELMGHKKVFEALGDKCRVASVDDQLSGVGFSMSKRADIIVKINSERIVRVKF